MYFPPSVWTKKEKDARTKTCKKMTDWMKYEIQGLPAKTQVIWTGDFNDGTKSANKKGNVNEFDEHTGMGPYTTAQQEW